MFKTHWPAISFLVILGVAVVAHVAPAIEAGACPSSSLQFWSNEQKVPIFSCWEFWLNRYQGLLGNLITAGVAAATLWFFFKELRTANQQAAVAASQGLRVIASELEQERLRVFKFDREIGDRIGVFASRPLMYQLDNLREVVGSLTRILEVEMDSARHNWQRRGADDSESQWFDYYEAVSVAFNNASEISAQIRSFSGGSIDNYVVDRSTVTELVEPVEIFHTALDALRDACLDQIICLEEKVHDVWIQIRKFEAVGIHGRS